MDDREIIRRAQAGDRSAFGALFDAYYAYVYRYLYERLGGAPEAEDLSQEVFLLVLSSIDEYPSSGTIQFEEWLLGVAQRLLTEHYSRAHVQPELVAPHIAVSTTWSLNPDALALLSKQQQRVVACRYHAGLSVRQTATALGLDTPRVKRMERAALGTWIRYASTANDPPECDPGTSWR